MDTFFTHHTIAQVTKVFKIALSQSVLGILHWPKPSSSTDGGYSSLDNFAIKLIRDKLNTTPTT